MSAPAHAFRLTEEVNPSHGYPARFLLSRGVQSVAGGGGLACGIHGIVRRLLKLGCRLLIEGRLVVVQYVLVLH
jgi:hypothetical protein